ncbi:MAG: hypothetical protein RIC18_04695 [Hoeflea sp.]|uniref:hypothetical protein n=1 Tax=Hoeflea sp. TaxID=1940281 RepID=UPI0032F0802A
MPPANPRRRHHVKLITAGALLAVLAIGYFVFAGPHASEISSNGHMAHSEATAPREPGQSAFAAVAEIVALLDADPQTDWSKVDIGALRAHLVDMDRLMLDATARATIAGNTATFRVSGSGEVLRAIQAMVPAHGRELDNLVGWQVSSETTSDGALLAITVDNPSEIERIRALGFFGLMTIGSHHQPHHLAMARGTMTEH